MKKSEAVKTLEKSLIKIEQEIEQTFYYLEEEELLAKTNPDKWNIAEIFAHLNYTHTFYLDYFLKKLEQAPTYVEDHEIKRSWAGLLMERGLRPTKNKKRRFKIKTFKKIDPLVKQKQGVKIVPNVVFRDFTSDIKQLHKVLELIKTKDIRDIKTATFIPYLRIDILDALFYLIAHLQRHIVQARELI